MHYSRMHNPLSALGPNNAAVSQGSISMLEGGVKKKERAREEKGGGRTKGQPGLIYRISIAFLMVYN